MLVLKNIDALIAVLYGLVQGITEWLPISSTAHLMLLRRWVPTPISESAFSLFLVAVQLASALAVVALYLPRLIPVRAAGEKSDLASVRSLWTRMLVGCLPAGAVGILLDDALDAFFRDQGRSEAAICVTLVLYGFLFLLIERVFRCKTRKNLLPEEMSLGDAFGIGCFQILALIPGTSRSGATVIGAMCLGYERGRAAEFSFFLAIPMMLGATLLRAVKLFFEGVALSVGEIVFFVIGSAAAFFVSLAALRFLVAFVRRRGFALFGWYRIALSVLIFLLMAT